MAVPSRGAFFEEQRRERGVGGLGSGSRDGDVGEAVGAHALLHEVDEALLEGAQRGLTEIGKLTALRLGQGRNHRRDIDPEKAAVVLYPGPSLGLRDPGVELNISELRPRYAGADRGCGDHQHTGNGERIDVETAFKNPKHPFRVAIVCAMWLTGFDVECLSTLYIDKPMKAHTLMQAIARANRVYPGKDFGLIVDYNGMLASLRAALAQYALGDDGTGGEEIIAPIEERVQALLEAIEATEAHLRSLGFDPSVLLGSKGFVRIRGLKDAVEAVYSTDESKRRFEILARQVFIRFKALLMEPSAWAYAERHDNIEAIYKKLTERRDTADVTELLKELHRIVNEAIRTQAPGDDQAEGLTFDLSQIDLEKLRDEFAKKVRRKATALQDIRDIVEQKLAEMLARNPARMDYQVKYEAIIADYNREKDRTTIEETFRRLVELVNSLDQEQKRATKEGLGEDELALFDLLLKDNLDKTSRERVKQASRDLLASIKARLAELDRFWEKEQTKADVEVFILDEVFASLPSPPFTPDEKKALAASVYAHVWQQAVNGGFAQAA
ncbi:type I restriction enzyme endonuclease domain-containing protein [Pseudotabrizicola sp. L79]|uniref:type I restriction enzyme endonuclease domain-containing protein n=1 Tax=Pseudotabrizicola sp. L79 TaxID=3118402 RepID=UPI002F94C64C